MRKYFTYLLAIACILFVLIVRAEFASAASNLESGISELAQQISKNMTETGKKKVAVVEFSDLNGNIRSLGQFIAEELITELFLISPGQFEVVERRQLMKVLDEQKLTTSGLLDAKAMDSVGKILGIEAIVTGSITDLGNSVKVNARMIGVDTAKVFAVARTSIPKIGIVATMWDTLIPPGPNIPTIPQPTDKPYSSSVYTNKNSKIFHKYNCSGLNAEGAVEFKSAQRAIKAGGIACRRCNPSKQVQIGLPEGPETITSTPSFQNDFLRVTLQSISKSTVGRYRSRVNLVFTLENISNENIFVGLQGRGRDAVSLVGNLGSKWSLDEFNGINSVRTARTRYLTGEEGYSMFNPGAINTIVMSFRLDSDETEDTAFSFSANMLRLVDKSLTRFSIGISNMRVTQ